MGTLVSLGTVDVFTLGGGVNLPNVGRDCMLLDVQDLKVSFHSRDGVNEAVKGISFHLEEGKTLAIVGERGSGKSVTSMALTKLLRTLIQYEIFEIQIFPFFQILLFFSVTLIPHSQSETWGSLTFVT